MESRKIIVINNSTQSKKVFMSEAETLGQLKADLDANGVDYTDMVFYEGLSKTELKSDDSILPHDITHNGVVTNELAFLLSPANKKIKSGMISRPEAYKIIKTDNLGDAIKATFGKSFTNVSTMELSNFLEHYLGEDDDECEGLEEVNCTTIVANTANALAHLINILEDDGTISEEDKDTLFDILHQDMKCANEEKPQLKSSYSDEELNDMFSDYEN